MLGAPALLAARAAARVEALGEGATILRDAFDAVHPGLHRYATSAALRLARAA